MWPSISEEERLRQLRALDLDGVAADPALLELLAFAEDVFQVPVVRVHLVEEDRQYSLGGMGTSPAFDMHRGASVCTHTIRQEDTLILPDMREDPFFGGHALVHGPPYLCFYAGAVLRAPGGAAVGTLCLIDYVPRHFSDADERRLIRFARLVEYHVTGGAARAHGGAGTGTDPVTGLPGREAVTARLEPALAAARDDNHPTPSTLLAIYLDDVADLRASGQITRADSFLCSVAKRIGAVLPEQAAMGRWDSDELLIWAPATVPGCDSETLGHVVAGALQEPVSWEGKTSRVNASASVVRAPDAGQTVHDLTSVLRNLTRNPRTRDRVGSASFAGGHVELAREIELGQRLDEALTRGRIQSYFQPRVSLKNGRLTGMEALARWHDDKLGWISPAEFIPLAERTGRIAEATRAMLEAVCTQLRAWLAEGYSVPPVAVNISPEELRDERFPELFMSHVNDAGLMPDQLELEITERGFMDEMTAVVSGMRQLAAFGTQFAIDDFGTGYSSLRYLQQLPAQQLKIDKSFVGQVHRDPATARIVEAMIGMATGLRMEVIAEGVESPEQAEILEKKGVAHAQGNFYHAPLPADQIPQLLRYDIEG